MGPAVRKMQLAPDHTSVITPPSAVSQAELDPVVVKDICLTQVGMPKAFVFAASLTTAVQKVCCRWAQGHNTCKGECTFANH